MSELDRLREEYNASSVEESEALIDGPPAWRYIAALESEHERLDWLLNGLMVRWPGTDREMVDTYADLERRWTHRNDP